MAHTPDTLVEEKPYASESLSSTEPSSSTMPTLASSPSVDVDQAADMKRVDNPASPLAKDSFEDDKLESNMSSDEEERAKQLLAEREAKYLTGWPLFLSFIGMLLAVFLIALDQSILSPALPVIASSFDALPQLAWVASAYFLTQAALLLLYGQALTVFDRKRTFLLSIAIFEIGSIICGAAPNINTLIFGRAFAGCGAAGIFVSVLAIIAEVTRLEQRPKLLGSFGGVFAISSSIGPLIGGVFTDKVTWRLCFLINVPVGLITIISVIFILPATPAPPLSDSVRLQTEQKVKRWSRGRLSPKPESILFRLAVLDWTGSVLMLALITCLLLALQWGGVVYPWQSATILGLFAAFACLVVGFIVYEWRFAGVTGILPLRLLSRTQIGASIESFCLMFSLLLGTYFLPIYYQAAKYASAEESGINILPFMLGIVVAAAGSGIAVSAIGRYKPWLVLGPLITCVGGGLLYTITAESSTAQLVGYQILLALGVGTALQNVLIAVQCDSDELDIPQRSSLVTFTQLVGGVIGIAISSTLFNTQLIKNLAISAPNAPPSVLTSVLSIRDIDPTLQAGVIVAYVKALNVVYILGIPAGLLAGLSGLLVRDLSVKGKNLMGASG